MTLPKKSISRSVDRILLDVPIEIEVAGLSQLALLKDLSVSGCQLEIATKTFTHKTFLLRFTQVPVVPALSVNCEVIWQRGNNLGVRFQWSQQNSILPKKVIERIVSFSQFQ